MNEKKKIFIISVLDFWSMGKGKGGPAFYRTLTGLKAFFAINGDKER